MPSNQHEVHLTLQAQSNLRDIAAYHKLMVGPTSAKRITDQILNGMEKLGDFPNMGITPPSKIIAEAGFKMLIIGEYLCFYRINDDSILVHHIVHGSTDYIKSLFG